MSVSYTCPNPNCGVTLKTPNKVAPGKRVKCPKCGEQFIAEPEEKPGGAAPAPAGGALKFADEKPAAAKPADAPPPKKQDDDEDPESVKKGYGVVKETEEEIRAAEKNKPKFTAVQDKFKKSARGPAMSLLVMPANLLTAEGLLTAIGGLVIFVSGMWPLVFSDAAIGDEELEEAIITMLLGTVIFGWGCGICFGASQMQELASYPMAMAGAVMGILPLLVGIYAIIMLQNPKVKAGFEETEGGPDDEDEDEGKDDEDEDEDDEDDEEDDEDKDEGRAKKSRRKRKDEAEDEDDDEEEEE